MSRPYFETVVIALRTCLMPGLQDARVVGGHISILNITTIDGNHDQIVSALIDAEAYFPQLIDVFEKAIDHVKKEKCETEEKVEQIERENLNFIRSLCKADA